MGNTYKKGSIKASYSKDEEKKYNDRAIGAGFTQYGFGNANSGATTNAITSVGFKTDSWYGFNFNQPLATGVAITQNLVRGLATGTTSITRVGNKVKCKYIKGSILLTANQENSSADVQNGEKVMDQLATGKQYLRTSWRIVIVKDTQSNSKVQASAAQSQASRAVGVNPESEAQDKKMKQALAAKSPVLFFRSSYFLICLSNKA